MLVNEDTVEDRESVSVQGNDSKAVQVKIKSRQALTQEILFTSPIRFHVPWDVGGWLSSAPEG